MDEKKVPNQPEINRNAWPYLTPDEKIERLREATERIARFVQVTGIPKFIATGE